MTPPQAEATQDEIAKETAFVEQFATKMDKAAEDGAGDDAEKPEPETKDDADDKDEPEKKPEPEKKDEKDADEKKDDEDKEEEKVVDDKKEDEDKDEEEASPDKISDATAAALKKHGLKLTMDDVPEAVRPLMQKKMAHVDAVLTRALMEAREYRKTEREVLAERKYFDEHPELYLAEQFYRLKPEERDDLIVKLQGQIDRFADTDKAKLFEHETKEERDAARQSVEAQYTEREEQNQRADKIAVYAHTAAVKLGLPWETVENAVVVALNQKPEDQRDLTDAELDAIVDSQARLWRRHTAAAVREDKKSAIRERTKDRATTSPAVRIGGGSAPMARTSTTKIAANDEEFTEQMLAKLGR